MCVLTASLFNNIIANLVLPLELSPPWQLKNFLWFLYVLATTAGWVFFYS